MYLRKIHNKIEINQQLTLLIQKGNQPMNKNKKPITICFSVLLLISAVCAGFWTAGLSFGDEPDEHTIYYEGKKLSEEGYYIKNTLFVPVSVVERYGDLSGISIDTVNMKINIDLSKQNIIMADDATTDFIKKYGGTVYVPLKNIEDRICVPMNVMEQFLKLSASFSNNSIRIYSYSGTEKIARVNGSNVYGVPSLSSREEPEPFSLAKGEMVFIEGETDQYYIIKTQDEKSGYVMKTNIEISDLDLSEVDFYAPKKDKYIQGSEKINLVWQYVGGVTPPAPEFSTAGIDILSPTWFDLIVNGGGSVENNGDLGYTDSAHEKGYKIWATITNNMSTSGSTAYTTTVFNNSSLLNKSVAQYIFYSCLYDADGINIDYEQVSDSDAAGLTAFTALMRNYTERQGLNLSIDTLIPKPWTIEYDRDALAEYVDYIAVMTYDEHYGGSPVAGSVASLPWVEEAVKATLKEVPAEKLLLGIPMYTRVWVVDNSGKVIRNPSASMPYIRSLIEEKNLIPEWLEKEKQYFIQYPNGTYTDKIWVEDARSVANRLDLVQKYDLAGSACWQYSQASEDIWDVFEGMLKKNKTLNDYE